MTAPLPSRRSGSSRRAAGQCGPEQAAGLAEHELDAACRLADLNAAAKKLMRAKEALKRLAEAAGA